jgi:quinolinate synthase
MKKIAPEKNFIPISRGATCKYMKVITVEKILEALRNELPEVRVPIEIASKAKLAIDRMVSTS